MHVAMTDATIEVPHGRVPFVPRSWQAAEALERMGWDELPLFASLVRSADGGAAEQPTRLRAAWDLEALYLRFECEDRDAWGTWQRRDDPLYEEEVVEVFLEPGEREPASYFELEVSPLGVLFDARIHNPTSRRAEMVIETAWDCPGLRWQAGRGAARQDWWAALAIPWAALAPATAEVGPPLVWRANFYRIERPRDRAAPELSAWSPTMNQPVDFHRPARFGMLSLAPPAYHRTPDQAVRSTA
jgi:hypothetical protein